MASSSRKISDFRTLKKAVKKVNEDKRKQEEARKRAERQAISDRELFLKSIGDVTPLETHDRIEPVFSFPKPIPVQRIADEKQALLDSLSDEFSVESLLETDETLSYAKNGIGPDVVRKLRRGHWVIQDQLDLHGMRRDEAREMIVEFLRQAAIRGIRCVRIVHGKGLGSVNNEPVLKKLVHKWLVQRADVVAFCQAKPADGGSGAVVVLLKGR
ncbi:Smr/MutS family protein [Oxalobacter aliiformigenes]|uniref:Smr/MutS family protein n=1 Tax=Oxalobacter aliiformigenes TaxID=2946593 RepID=UPI0022AEDF43|nr:Smr/MutS family protein [Oxalobacter aliiformigenes]MCZ4065693.1 Smr/MutS family protein [Oxalobacter aliiformigenes]WAV99704.1 Smr/MutS family protein [Oxalobacter aliiformigenes]